MTLACEQQHSVDARKNPGLNPPFLIRIPPPDHLNTPTQAKDARVGHLPGGGMRRAFLLAFLILFSVLASADSKITTRNTTMGHSSESTVYIKGARERTEGATMGPGASLVTIMQC